MCQHAHNLANALCDRGHVVAVATGVGFETKGFPRKYQALEALDRFRPRPILLARLFRFVRAFRPDVVHIEAAVHPGSCLAIWKALTPLVQCPFVYTAHDVFPKKPRFYHPWVLRVIYRGMTHILVNAVQNRQEIGDRFGVPPERISFVSVGELTAFVRDVPTGPMAGIPPGRKVILFFGIVEPRKGLMTLIRAFARVRDSLPEAFLVIAGKPYEDFGPYVEEVHKLGLERDVLLRFGYVPRSRVCRRRSRTGAPVCW